MRHSDNGAVAWAEHYRKDKRIDVINGTATAELVEWLRAWYETPVTSTSVSDDESMDSYEQCVIDRDPVAIITGSIGCGKSTVVSNAAQMLGLSVLEVNASVCRSGKRVRDIVGEALSTHRILSNQNAFRHWTNSHVSDPTSAKTLVLFEEVDELQEDEKGFWSTVLKLVTASHSRRPIVCTANSFTVQMRQFFIQHNGPVTSDLINLFVRSKTEPIINPVSYKHIAFPSRSERQTVAVINRINSSKSSETLFNMADCLAVACGSDTRKAINLLHFWGLPGLDLRSSPTSSHTPFRIGEMQRRVGIDLIQVVMQSPICSPLFRVGSANYSQKMNEKIRESTVEGNGSETNIERNNDALEAWTVSLEMFSYSDVIRGTVQDETVNRNEAGGEQGDAICQHADVHSCLQVSEDLDIESVQLSRNFLLFGRNGEHLSDIARGMRENTEAIHTYLPEDMPTSRRKVLSEYIPFLKTVAVSHNRAEANGCSSRLRKGRLQQTRSRTRRNGSLALDLHASTLSTLKKSSIR